MPKIYTIRHDKNYQTLDLPLVEVMQRLPKGIDLDEVVPYSYRNTPIESWWTPPQAKFIQTKNTGPAIPDITLWQNTALVLSPKAYQQLSAALTTSGEFLPIKIGQDEYHIFICFVIGDSYTYEHHQGKLRRSKNMTSNKSVEDLTIFTSTLPGCETLFCGEGFRRLVELSSLGGIEFQENSSEVGR